MKKAIYFIPLVILLLLVALFWRGLDLNPGLLPSALLDKPVPEFGLPSLASYDIDNPEQMILITEDVFQGQISLLHVWATWCPYCRMERPVINAIAEVTDIPIYALNYRDDSTAAKQWLENYGDPYEDVAYDVDGRVGIDFGVYGTPEMFLIDQQGIIRYKRVGPMTPQIWQEQFVPIIEMLQENDDA